MAQPLFTIEADGALPESAEVVGFHGSEGLSRPYLFEVYVHVPIADAEGVDLDAALLKRASLRVHREDGAIRRTHHGVVRAMEHLHDHTDAALYRLEVVPALWLLSLGHHSRVHTKKSVPDILEATLREGGLASDDYELRLRGSFRPLEHVCQYKESDLDFLHRWMEREGIYYFFEHDGDREKLVLVNAAGDHAPLAPGAVRFLATGGGDSSAAEAMETFTARHAARPKKSRVTDHDPQRPSTPVRGEADAASNGRGDVVRWSAHVTTSSDATRLARLRAEERMAQQTLFSGAGRGLDLRSGYTFELDEHPLATLNGTYLAVSVEHRGSQVSALRALQEHLGFTEDRAYHVRLTAIRADRQFRAEHRTPWPRVPGLELGVVDGPVDSDYAQLDEHGRYLVRLRYDENAHQPGTASTRIRMMQPHAGEPEGMHLPLRKGTEVLIAFLGGDPDQPVIAGAAPDAEHPSVVVQANETQNVIHTGGNNRIEMEDTDGHQYIDLYSPPKHSALHLGAHHPRGYHGGHDHNFVLTTDGNGLVHTGANLDVTVGGEKHEHVVKLVDEKYDLTQTTTVKGNVTETYKSDQITNVTSHTQENYGKHIVEVKGEQVEACQTQETTVRTVLVERHGSQNTTVTGNLTETTPVFRFTVSGDSQQRNGTLGWTIAPGTTTITAGTSFDMTAPNFNLLAAMQALVNTPARQETGGNRTETTPLKIKYGVFKSAGTLMSGAQAVLKVDIVPGVNLANYLNKNELNVVSIGIAGAKATFSAVTLRMGPIKVKITGMDMKV